MEATVKHRIVGSLMLLSLAVIILPFWLDGAGLKEYQLTQQPVIPDVPELGVIEPLDAAGVMKNVDPSDQQVIELSPIQVEQVPNTANTDAAPKKGKINPDNGVINQQGLPDGWVVQLGNFGNRSNAKRLKDKLIKAGFAAYMVPNGTLFKVLVGPELNRSKAEALQKQLKNKFKMAGMVTLYEVEKP